MVQRIQLRRGFTLATAELFQLRPAGFQAPPLIPSDGPGAYPAWADPQIGRTFRIIEIENKSLRFVAPGENRKSQYQSENPMSTSPVQGSNFGILSPGTAGTWFMESSRRRTVVAQPVTLRRCFRTAKRSKVWVAWSTSHGCRNHVVRGSSKYMNGRKDVNRKLASFKDLKG